MAYQIKPTSTYSQLIKAGWIIQANTGNYANTTKVFTLLKRGLSLITPDNEFILKPIRSGVTNEWYRIELRRIGIGGIGEYQLSEGGLSRAIDRMNLPF